MGAGEVSGKIFFCFCGPQGSACCTVLSVWGFVMLLLMGVALKLQSVALYEDLKIDSSYSDDPQKNVDHAYTNAALACFMSAVIYLVYLIFSGVMIVVNIFRSRAIKRSKEN